MRGVILSFVVLALPAACPIDDRAAQRAQPEAADAAGYIAPETAVMGAANAWPDSYPGRFAFEVLGSGEDDGHAFLNSQADYRDQRTLTVRIPASARSAFTSRFGEDPTAFFRGKTIAVTGEARRVRIDFLNAGRPTGLYYFQTHVVATDPDQIAVIAD